MRRCIGCMNSYPKAELQRFTLREGRLMSDPDGKAEGRGVYLCRKEECRALALKKNAFRRSFRKNIDQAAIDAVIEELREYEKI